MKSETSLPQQQPPARAERARVVTPNLGKRRISFEVEAPPGSEVFVAGDFNGWSLAKHRMIDKGHPGKFRRHVYVDPGKVEYKFCIDGEWRIDSKCNSWKPNDFGTLNSVLQVD